ncbi:hypothetical protein RB195_021510 [Necator americanus]|uniref:Uncharacterized protein n=1 Tax=Necator americanus TaxID=51031 RepID=A0ABR1EBC9_NECAM
MPETTGCANGLWGAMATKRLTFHVSTRPQFRNHSSVSFHRFFPDPRSADFFDEKKTTIFTIDGRRSSIHRLCS